MIKIGHLIRAMLVVAAVVLATIGGRASAQQQQPMMMDGMDRTGVVHIESDHERELFARLLCTCGGCQREAISTCACSMAEDRRVMVRGWMKRGMSDEEIQAKYVKEFGDAALSVPPNEGKNRAVYLVPLAVIVIMGVFMIRVLRGFARKGEQIDAAARVAAEAETKKKKKAKSEEKRDDYDDKLDDELRDLDR